MLKEVSYLNQNRGIGKQCRTCSLPCTIFRKFDRCALVIKIMCNAGHKFTWASSPVIRNIKCNAIYQINLDLELDGTKILKTVQYFIKYHGIWSAQMNTFTYQ